MCIEVASVELKSQGHSAWVKLWFHTGNRENVHPFEIPQ